MNPAPTVTIPGHEPRQLWVYPSMSVYATSSCKPFTLPSGGVLTLNPTSTITFTTDVVYQPSCLPSGSALNASTSIIETNNEPFYASTTVLIYVVATTTAIAWFLLTLLFLAPGRYSSNAPARGTGWLAGRGFSNIIANGTSILSTDSRPWLQKVAAFLVTIALTTASADTFAVAAEQYSAGYMNATAMRNAVVGRTDIRIMRVISDIFIWLAQVQTLIRLFPRRKEKLIIKWFGFLLILLDTVFSCLNSFFINSRALPRVNQDAIPALSYLFQLSISLLYGAWVFYYVATKRRYAFFTTEMPSITIISVLAIVSILIPVGFFVADISEPPVAAWGDFFRWVGAAAASVLVWEWVERIEFLEREEKRDGILGREIFEEDEMVVTGGGVKKKKKNPGSTTSRSSSMNTKHMLGTMLADVYLRIPKVALLKLGKGKANPNPRQDRPNYDQRLEEGMRRGSFQLPASAELSTMPQSGTPVSRTDTDTPSTVYAVHYHSVTDTPPSSTGRHQEAHQSHQDNRRNSPARTHNAELSDQNGTAPFLLPGDKIGTTDSSRNAQAKWQFAQQIFKRRKRSPPLEIKQAMSLNAQVHNELEQEGSRNLMRQKLGRFAGLGGLTKDTSLAVFEQPTVIPAPPRGHAWSPDIMRHSPVQPRGRNLGALHRCNAEEDDQTLEGEVESRSTMAVTDVTLVASSPMSETDVKHDEELNPEAPRDPS